MTVVIKNVIGLDTAMFFNSTSLNKIRTGYTADFTKNSTFQVSAKFPEKLYLLVWSDDRFKRTIYTIKVQYYDRDPDFETEALENLEYMKRKTAIQDEMNQSKFSLITVQGIR